MTRAARAALFAALCGCAAVPPLPPPPPPPPQALANLRVRIEEAVGTPESDGLAYARIFVDRRDAGQTEPARRAQGLDWSGRVPNGNHPLRIEYWTLPGAGEWARLSDDLQPRERFVRVEAGKVTRVRVRFAAGGRSHELSVVREPEAGASVP